MQGPAGRGALQLYDEFAGPEGLAPGFIEEFAKRFDGEGLDDMISPLIAELPKIIRGRGPYNRGALQSGGLTIAAAFSALK